jgi:hypothetical protein
MEAVIGSLLGDNPGRFIVYVFVVILYSKLYIYLAVLSKQLSSQMWRTCCFMIMEHECDYDSYNSEVEYISVDESSTDSSTSEVEITDSYYTVLLTYKLCSGWKN